MKEITKEFLESEVEIVAEQQQRKEIKLIGRQRKGSRPYPLGVQPENERTESGQL